MTEKPNSLPAQPEVPQEQIDAVMSSCPPSKINLLEMQRIAYEGLGKGGNVHDIQSAYGWLNADYNKHEERGTLESPEFIQIWCRGVLKFNTLKAERLAQMAKEAGVVYHKDELPPVLD